MTVCVCVNAQSCEGVWLLVNKGTFFHHIPEVGPLVCEREREGGREGGREGEGEGEGEGERESIGRTQDVHVH